MKSPKDCHWKAGKMVLRYIAGTSTYGLLYATSTDSDYAGWIDDQKSTSGYAFLFGRNLISWSSKKQPIVALYLTEAEYVAAHSTSCQAMWLKRLLSNFGYTENEPISILCNNTYVIPCRITMYFIKKKTYRHLYSLHSWTS